MYKASQKQIFVTSGIRTPGDISGGSVREIGGKGKRAALTFPELLVLWVTVSEGVCVPSGDAGCASQPAVRSDSAVAEVVGGSELKIVVGLGGSGRDGMGSGKREEAIEVYWGGRGDAVM